MNGEMVEGKERTFLHFHHRIQQLDSTIRRLERVILVIKGESEKPETVTKSPIREEPSLVAFINSGADIIIEAIEKIEKAREDLETALLS